MKRFSLLMGTNWRIQNIQDIAELQLCCGCGACAYVSPDEIEMVDVLDHGRRPRFRGQCPRRTRSDESMQVCPGIGLAHTFEPNAPGLLSELVTGWGPILEVWEGFATDPEIRFMGSSGGVATALGLYCIEQAGMHGVLQTSSRPDIPYLNRTVLSVAREELLAATGSRYSPASPCDGLKMIEQAPAPCVFVGKPCDVAAVAKTRGIRPTLDRQIGLTVAVFCAGTPSTSGTLEMLRVMGVEDPASVVSIRYRGNGWPGRAKVSFRKDGRIESRHLTYEQSWGEILQKYRPWRCHICPEHTGEFADIALGDPWYRRPEEDEPGSSLILVRSQRGRRVLGEAIRVGSLTVERCDPRLLPESQAGLLRGRGAVWGRVQTLRLLGVPSPSYQGVPMFPFWRTELSGSQKAQSVYGTVKRAITRRLWCRRKLTAFDSQDSMVAYAKSGQRDASAQGVR